MDAKVSTKTKTKTFQNLNKNCPLMKGKVNGTPFIYCCKCVTSGGLLSTNILLLWHNMATGHAPLSEVAKKNSKKSHPDDEQQSAASGL